jgi:hypothetical protein
MQAHLRTIRAEIGGTDGQRLAEIEELALRSSWRIEEARRILDPIIGRQTEEARATAPPEIRDALQQNVQEIRSIINDPSLSPEQRAGLVKERIDAIERFARQHAALASAINFQQARGAAQRLGAPPSEGLLVLDNTGRLTRNGEPTGSFDELLDQVSAANRTVAERGIGVEYVVEVPPSRGDGPTPVLVLTRIR